MSYFRHFSVAILCTLILFSACGNEEGSSSQDAANEDSNSDQVPATITSRQLFTASLEGNLNFVQEAAEQDIELEQQDEMGRTPLMLAAYNGHSDVVRFLLENEADPNAADDQGRTPLAFAASGPFPETVEILLENEADPNQVDEEEGWSPLMWAAAEGNEQVVRVLLDHGTDPNLEDKDNETASDFASDNGHSEIVELLKKAEKDS